MTSKFPVIAESLTVWKSISDANVCSSRKLLRAVAYFAYPMLFFGLILCVVFQWRLKMLMILISFYDKVNIEQETRGNKINFTSNITVQYRFWYLTSSTTVLNLNCKFCHCLPILVLREIRCFVLLFRCSIKQIRLAVSLLSRLNKLQTVARGNNSMIFLLIHLRFNSHF